MSPNALIRFSGQIMYIIMYMKTVSSATMRAQLASLLDEVTDEHEVVTITRNGEPAAVLIPADEWESWEENRYWSEPENAAQLREAIADPRPPIPFEEAFPEFVVKQKRAAGEL
jgi:antitoxin YefM